MKPITNYTLFDYISADAVDKLKDLMDKKDISIRKNRICLVGRAIEVRARKCFDLLFNKKKDDKYIASFYAYSIAIDYYLENPSPEHKYYIDKLLELGEVDSNVVVKTIESETVELYHLFFEKMEKGSNQIIRIMSEMCRLNSINKFIHLYEWVEQYYQICNLNFDELKNKFVSYSYHYERPDFLLYLESRNVNILLYEYGCGLIKANNIKDSKIFNYIIAKYKNLSVEQLNQIPGIKQLKSFIKEKYFLSYIGINRLFINLNKILELSIEFDDVNTCLKYLYEEVIKSCLSYSLCCDYYLACIYIILKKYPNINSLNEQFFNEYNIDQCYEHIEQNDNENFVKYKIWLNKLMMIHMKFSTLPISYTENNKLRQICEDPYFSENQTIFIEYLEMVLKSKKKLGFII
jgi:hypothetical protein